MRKRPPVFALLLVAVVAFACLPLALADFGSTTHYVPLRKAASTSADTLFGVDSLSVTVHFQDRMDLDWVHYVAPTFAGGDSAGLTSGILVFYSNDGINFYAASVAAHDTIFAGAEADTLRSHQLSSVPLLRAIRLRLVSTADNDTTIIGGYYIYR